MPQDWFSQFESKSKQPQKAERPVKDDWFEQFTAPAAPAPRRTHRTEDYLEPEQRGSAAGRFASGAWEMLNPVQMVKGAYQAVRHPLETGQALLSAQGQQFGKAAEAFGEGRYSEALGHTGAGLLPIVGPLAAEAGEQIGTGDIAGGLGKAAGMLAPFGGRAAVVGTAGKAIPQRVAGWAERGAASRVADVMTPRTSTIAGRRMGNRAQKLAPTLAKDTDVTSAWSRQGMQAEVKTKLLEAEAGLDAANDARLSARTFETEPIIKDLLAKRRELEAQAVEASKLQPKEIPPAKADVRAAKLQQAQVAKADRSFVMQWLADDLAEVPFQKGGTTPAQRAAAHERWRPGDPESAKYGFGEGAGRARGTPTQEMFHAAGIGGTRAQLAGRLERYASGKRRDPKLDKLADAMVEAWTGEKFDFDRISDATLTKIGGGNVRRDKFRNPVTMPDPSKHRPEVMARWFPEPGVTPIIEEALPKGAKVAEPLGKSVVPGPNQARVAPIDAAIREIERLGPVARYEALRTIRQSYDGPAKTVYNPSTTQDFLKVKGVSEGAADVAGTLREHLAKFDPETAAANADYSLYRATDDILKAAEEIERVRPKVGRRIISQLTGSIIGGSQGGATGAVAGFAIGPMLEKVFSSGYTTKLNTAKHMQRMAEAIRKGDVGRVTSMNFRLRQLSKQAEAVRSQQQSETDFLDQLIQAGSQ